MVPERCRALNGVRSGRTLTTLPILAAVGFCSFTSGMCIAGDNILIADTAEMLSLLGKVRDAHSGNLSRILTVEGEALMTVYARSDLASGEVQHVTETVWVRYAWERNAERRWSESRVLELEINGETAPPDHPEWLTTRHMVDREKHISVAKVRPGMIPSTEQYPPPILAATISPLRGEVEAKLNRIAEGKDVALSYGPGEDFDIRFYYSNGGQDLQQLLAGRIDILQNDPNGYPGLAVQESKIGGRRIVEMRTEMGAGDAAAMFFTTRFDLEQAGNPVYVCTKYNDIPLWESTQEYHYLEPWEVWYPSSALLRNWSRRGDRCVLTMEMRIMFGLKTSINRPWSNPNLFSLEGLGLREGDWVIDQFSGKAYPYEDYE